MLGEHVELGGISVGGVERFTTKLDHRNLQTEAEPEVRDALGARRMCRTNLPLNAAITVAAGNQDAVRACELRRDLCRIGVIKLFGVDPSNADVVAVRPTGVSECFHHGEIRVRELGVLPNDGDLHRRLLCDDLCNELLPLRKLRCGGRDAKFANEQVAKAELLKLQRHFVDGARSGGGDDRLHWNVGEEGDLLAHIIWDRMIGAEDNHVRLNTAAAQLLHRVLRWLRLQLTGCGEFWKEGDVDVERVAATNILLQLANRFNERK